MPSLSLDGDVCLVLEGGQILRAHSVYLQHASTVLISAFDCKKPADHEDGKAVLELSEYSFPPAAQSGAVTRLPLPGVTQMQAELLVMSLYSWARETWYESLSPPELVELARVAHSLDCSTVLELADKYMVEKCGVEQDVAEKHDENTA